MSVSSRTPEGSPHQCPVCGKIALLEPAYPGGDSICPSCRDLLWRFRDHFNKNVKLHGNFLEELEADSLDLVELIMELEEEFDVVIPNEDLDQIKTIADAIRYIRRFHGDETL